MISSLIHASAPSSASPARFLGGTSRSACSAFPKENRRDRLADIGTPIDNPPVPILRLPVHTGKLGLAGQAPTA